MQWSSAVGCLWTGSQQGHWAQWGSVSTTNLLLLLRSHRSLLQQMDPAVTSSRRCCSQDHSWSYYCVVLTHQSHHTQDHKGTASPSLSIRGQIRNSLISPLFSGKGMEITCYSQELCKDLPTRVLGSECVTWLMRSAGVGTSWPWSSWRPALASC